MLRVETLDTTHLSIVETEWQGLITTELTVPDYIETSNVSVIETSWVGEVKLPYTSVPDKIRTSSPAFTSAVWVQYGLIVYEYPGPEALFTSHLTIKSTSWS